MKTGALHEVYYSLSISGQTASLLHDVGHGHALVHHPQFAGRGVGGGGVHEDAPVLEGPVHVRHHGPDVPAPVGLPLLLGLDVLPDIRPPPLLVALVDGVDLAPGLDPHVGVGEDELPDAGVQHEPVDPVAGAEHDHGGAAVQGVTRGHDLAAGLERVPGGERALVRLLEDGEDGTDGNQTVNVRAAVEGVECYNVFSLTLSFHLYFIIIFLNTRQK